MQQTILMIIGLLSAINLSAADSQPVYVFDYTQSSNLPVFMYDEEGNNAVLTCRKRPFLLSLWCVDEQRHKPVMKHDTQEMVSHVALHPDGHLLVTTVGDSMFLWVIHDGVLVKKGSIKIQHEVVSMALSRRGTTLVTQDTAGQFLVYEVSGHSIDLIAKPVGTNGLFSSLLSKNVEATHLAVHPEGNAFLVGDNEGNVATFLVRQQAIISLGKQQVFKEAGITALMFISDTSLMVGSTKADLETWRFSNGMLSDAQILRKGGDQARKGAGIARFALSKDGKNIISLDNDGTLILWSLGMHGWQRLKELAHPQQTGYQDAFFSGGVPALWDTVNERAWVITKY